METPYPFPYQGSKRKLAPVITKLIPTDTRALIEPFAGAAAVSLAAAQERKSDRFLLNDINAPLIALWKLIIEEPEALAEEYRKIWEAQHGHEKEYYFSIRDMFNRTHRPEILLFLLTRCVKAAVRYNSKGEFNQGPDNRRKGTHPSRMREQIIQTSRLLIGRTQLSAKDYREAIQSTDRHDLVYMDPPYQGVCRDRDPRYIESLAFASFVETLDELNKRDIRYIVSYDGRTGTKTHGKLLPTYLKLTHLEINAGRSSQATLLGEKSITYESLYLSPSLHASMKEAEYNGENAQQPQQLTFL